MMHPITYSWVRNPKEKYYIFIFKTSHNDSIDALMLIKISITNMTSKQSRFYIHGPGKKSLIISKYIHHLLRVFYLVLGKSNDSYPTQCSCINATFSMVNCALYTGRWISKAQSQIETPSKYTSKEIELEKNY